MANLYKVNRLNGEIFYININAINLAFMDPKDKTITIYGAGVEKIFRVEEVPELIAKLDLLSGIKPENTPSGKTDPSAPAKPASAPTPISDEDLQL